MKNGPIKPNGNALLDVLLKGLKLTGEFNKATLGALSQVTKLYNGRIERQFIWEQSLSDSDLEDKRALGITPKELAKINAVVKALGHEIPSRQPSTDSQWDFYLSVPKNIKMKLIALYPKVGPELLTYALDLCTPFTEELNDLLSWVTALDMLYQSANDENDLFHGLFLNNHNFAKRAYDLAKDTDTRFSTTVLQALTDCRFSSLTMNSAQLSEIFSKLATFYKRHQSGNHKYSHHFGEYTFEVTIDEIKAFIKKEDYYPKNLLWRSKERPNLPLLIEIDEPLGKKKNSASL